MESECTGAKMPVVKLVFRCDSEVLLGSHTARWGQTCYEHANTHQGVHGCWHLFPSKHRFCAMYSEPDWSEYEYPYICGPPGSFIFCRLVC